MLGYPLAFHLPHSVASADPPMSYITARKFSCSGNYRSLPTTSEHSKRSRPPRDSVIRGATMANSEQESAAQSDVQFRVLPYKFEPLARPENQPEARAAVQNRNVNIRLGNTNWCECGNCVTMEKTEECNCCMESHKIVEKLKKRRPKNKPDVTCVTQLRGFQSVCLDPDVLETAYLQYKEEHGTMQATLEEKYRYTSYRQLVRWCYGVVGRKVRVPLPSCAVNAIRTAFPSEGPYTGFNWPELD